VGACGRGGFPRSFWMRRAYDSPPNLIWCSHSPYRFCFSSSRYSPTLKGRKNDCVRNCNSSILVDLQRNSWRIWSRVSCHVDASPFPAYLVSITSYTRLIPHPSSFGSVCIPHRGRAGAEFEFFFLHDRPWIAPWIRIDSEGRYREKTKDGQAGE